MIAGKQPHRLTSFIETYKTLIFFSVVLVILIVIFSSCMEKHPPMSTEIRIVNAYDKAVVIEDPAPPVNKSITAIPSNPVTVAPGDTIRYFAVDGVSLASPYVFFSNQLRVQFDTIYALQEAVKVGNSLFNQKLYVQTFAGTDSYVLTFVINTETYNEAYKWFLAQQKKDSVSVLKGR